MELNLAWKKHEKSLSRFFICIKHWFLFWFSVFSHLSYFDLRSNIFDFFLSNFFLLFNFSKLENFKNLPARLFHSPYIESIPEIMIDNSQKRIRVSGDVAPPPKEKLGGQKTRAHTFYP